jgi:hypothetical protein
MNGQGAFEKFVLPAFLEDQILDLGPGREYESNQLSVESQLTNLELALPVN